MLYYTTIEPIALELLKRFFTVPYFSNLFLAGGTSLALQIGHRKSIDLDLFGTIEADDISIASILKSFGNIQLVQRYDGMTV